MGSSAGRARGVTMMPMSTMVEKSCSMLRRKKAAKVRQVLVSVHGVLGQAIDDAAQWRGVEEGHGRPATPALCQSTHHHAPPILDIMHSDVLCCAAQLCPHQSWHTNRFFDHTSMCLICTSRFEDGLQAKTARCGVST